MYCIESYLDCIPGFYCMYHMYVCNAYTAVPAGDLLDVITTKHMKKLTNVLRENCTNVAFIGRPNVGKSSLFNR